MSELTHASFFSGAGGLDLGFERAGIRTVSHSEIDPYASAVLARHWATVPNLGDIVALNDRDKKGGADEKSQEWKRAQIWSGGFPCQDLSLAGKRTGFGGERSVLAFTFLDLVERHRPRWLVLENVPGLLSSGRGADFGRLLYEMVGLRYGVAWRILDAQYFGVAQRRRRVFIIAANEDHLGGFGEERAAEVLVECQGACGHLEASRSPREKTPAPRAGSIDEGGAEHPEAHPNRVRAIDGLGGRLDDRSKLAAFSFPSRFGSNAKVTADIAQSFAHSAGAPAVLRLTGSDRVADDDLMNPTGLESSRYRCIGNGVVAPVAEWIGRRLVAVDAAHSGKKEAQG